MSNNIRELQQGSTYAVVSEFVDYDGIIHPIGETWTVQEITFLPYHDGLSLFVIENGQKKQYRFQEIAEEQEKLLSDFMEYVELVEKGNAHI